MPRRMRDRMRDRRRMREDRRSSRRDYGSYGFGNDYHYDYPEYNTRYDYRTNEKRSPSRMGRDSEYDREHSMDYNYYEPYMTRRDYMGRRDRRRDYRDRASEEDYLSDEELMEWSKELLMAVPEKDKPYFTKDNMEKRAKEMGVNYKDFTFSELYTAALMLYNDYSKTLGTANMDLYIRMAKDFFEDDDAELQGSEKLATYYDEIVCAE